MRAMRFYTVTGTAMSRSSRGDFAIQSTWIVATFLEGEGARADELAAGLRERLAARVATDKLTNIYEYESVDPRQVEILKTRPAVICYLVQISCEDPSVACVCNNPTEGYHLREGMFHPSDACALHGGDPDASRRETMKRNLAGLSVAIAKVPMTAQYDSVLAGPSDFGVEAWGRLSFADASLVFMLERFSQSDRIRLTQIGVELGLRRRSGQSDAEYQREIRDEIASRWDR